MTSVKEFFKTHRDEIMDIVATEHLSQHGSEILKFEFVSQLSGKKYHSIPIPTNIPFQRFALNNDLFAMLYLGVNEDELAKILQKIHYHLSVIEANGKGKDASLSEAKKLTLEIERRKAEVVHFDIMVNILCNNLIREEEDPNKINFELNKIKCKEIIHEIESGNAGFFFSIPQLAKFKELQSMSTQELTAYLVVLRQQAEFNQKWLERLISGKVPESETKS